MEILPKRRINYCDIPYFLIRQKLKIQEIKINDWSSKEIENTKVKVKKTVKKEIEIL